MGTKRFYHREHRGTRSFELEKKLSSVGFCALCGAWLFTACTSSTMHILDYPGQPELHRHPNGNGCQHHTNRRHVRQTYRRIRTNPARSVGTKRDELLDTADAGHRTEVHRPLLLPRLADAGLPQLALDCGRLYAGLWLDDPDAPRRSIALYARTEGYPLLARCRRSHSSLLRRIAARRTSNSRNDLPLPLRYLPLHLRG